MSDKNIDKDIEEFKQELIYSIKCIQEGTSCDEGFRYTCFGEGDIEQVLKIIEELETKNKELTRNKVRISSLHYQLEKQDKELETYKKIAEKLAEILSHKMLETLGIKPRIEDLIESARKEVENGQNNNT